MILDAFIREENKTDEEKLIDKEYAIYRELTGELTDKELNDKYNKHYLLEE